MVESWSEPAERDVSIADERRSRVRTTFLALALVPGFGLGLTYLLQSAPEGSASWIVISVRLLGVLFIALASNCAWHLAKNRAVTLSFTVYGLAVVGLFVIAVVLVANGGSG